MGMVTQPRLHPMYWDIFVVLCVVSSLFGYWFVLLCPAFRFCGKWNRRFSAMDSLDCCSWKTWTISSILALLLVVAALILAMEPQTKCQNEVVRLYKESHGDGVEIEITDIEIGYCLWYLIC